MNPRLVEVPSAPYIAFIVTDDITSIEARALARGALKQRYKRAFYVSPRTPTADLERIAREAMAEGDPCAS